MLVGIQGAVELLKEVCQLHYNLRNIPYWIAEDSSQEVDGVDGNDSSSAVESCSDDDDEVVGLVENVEVVDTYR